MYTFAARSRNDLYDNEKKKKYQKGKEVFRVKNFTAK